jgi:trans-4-hydroxy-L-proline dehydratase
MHPNPDLIALDTRTLTLRSRVRQRKTLIPPPDGDPRLVARSLQASTHITSWSLRRGLVTRDLLAGLKLEVDELELLVGRPAPDRPEWQAERPEAWAFLAQYYPHLYTPGQSGHCQLHLAEVFELGIDGLSERGRGLQSQAVGKESEVYQSFLFALEGLANLCKNAAQVARRALPGSSKQRQAELKAMAVACEQIACLPPRTFRQALQLTWLIILGCHFADRAWLVVPGHLDRTLGAYYKADLEAGRLTPEMGLLLIEGLYLLVNEFIPDGLAVSVMVGGRDAGGNDLTNEVSYLCLEALRRTRLVYPSVGICWHSGTPQALTDLAVELIAGGIANPAFFGDETIQRGLQLYGVPPQESWDYINSTCVEITPVGSSNVWVASPYFSTNKLLLDEIAAQAISETPAEDFETLMNSYRSRLAREIARAVAVENQNRLQRQQHGVKPLQSLFTRDCITRGRDIDDGGARYNWVECSFVGLANLADSLFVLNEEVFEQQRLTLGALNQILQANFEGYENERQRFMHAYSKYGNDCAAVDNLVGEMVQFVRTECQRYQMLPDQSPYVAGAFCWVMHEMLGRECGATPDGRKAGFPFADGCGPAQGRERKGPTAAVLSVTTWDSSPLIGGAAFNMKFSASLFRSPEAVQRLRDLIITFLQRGGFEIQVNVVDAQMLRQAQVHPDEYQDLVVRIGGYTDYFTRLTPEMQAEVILRTEYSAV